MILYNGFPPSYFIYSFVILSLSLYNKFMDKFVIITAPRETINTIDDSSSSNDSDSELQPPKKVAKMSHYKDNLTYNPAWKKRYNWMDYDSALNGMVCKVCMTYGHAPAQARGAWITRGINNWVKATTLLAKHEKSDWHKAAVEKMALSQSAEEHGSVVELITAATEEEKKENREFIKKLIRSLYFLVKHHIPHTTTFEGLIMLQIENGDIKLEARRATCPGNATYGSYVTIVELLSSISKTIEKKILTSLKASPYYSLMADESTDVSSQEELSVCARWIEEYKPVEHFLGIVHVKETNAKALSYYLTTFLQSKNIGFGRMRGLGFDGTNTMSGHISGVQRRLRVLAPSAIYIHCRSHKLQLAAVNACAEHVQIKRVLGTMLTIWKAFHYSPKKAEKLSLIQAELQSPEIKMVKPSDTRWLARERAVCAVRRSIPALVRTFEDIYDETGDAEAHGIATLLSKYKTVACIYMLSDVLDTVAKLQGFLQGKAIDLGSVPLMVNSTTERLTEIKENVNSTTWFKNHSLVFTDDTQLGGKNIVIMEEEKIQFLQTVYRPYIQSVIDHIRNRMECTDLVSAMSVFDPRHLPKTELQLSPNYGMEKLKMLINYYSVIQHVNFGDDEGISQPDIDGEETEAEWKLFRRVILRQFKSRSLQDVLSKLINSGDISIAFPNLSNLAAIVEVLPVTTATVERTFSSMKLIKTRLRSRMGEDTLEHTMRICIEGPDRLTNDMLEEIVDHYKGLKNRRIVL